MQRIGRLMTVIIVGEIKRCYFNYDCYYHTPRLIIINYDGVLSDKPSPTGYKRASLLFIGRGGRYYRVRYYNEHARIILAVRALISTFTSCTRTRLMVSRRGIHTYCVNSSVVTR